MLSFPWVPEDPSIKLWMTGNIPSDMVHPNIWSLPRNTGWFIPSCSVVGSNHENNAKKKKVLLVAIQSLSDIPFHLEL